MNFAEAKSKLRKPGATLVLEPWVFKDDWEGKPDAPVCVGLRLVGETDKMSARSQAVKTASEIHPNGGDDWTDCFNDAIQLQIDAIGICDPNDVSRPAEVLEFPEDQAPNALTSKGAAFIFQAIQRYEIASSPIGLLATPQDLQRLAAMLGHLDPAMLSPGPSRTITYLIELLEPLVGELVDASSVDDAADEGAIFIGKKRVVGGADGPG